MSAIETVGNAVAYDDVERMLANGASLALCYAYAAQQVVVVDDSDDAPVSSSAPTVAPTRK